MSDKVIDIILEEIKELRKEVGSLRKDLAKSNTKLEGINTRVMFICALGGSLVTVVAEVATALFLKGKS